MTYLTPYVLEILFFNIFETKYNNFTITIINMISKLYF